MQYLFHVFSVRVAVLADTPAALVLLAQLAEALDDGVRKYLCLDLTAIVIIEIRVPEHPADGVVSQFPVVVTI